MKTHMIESCAECGKPGRFVDNCCPVCAPIVKERISSAIRAACPESRIPEMIATGAVALRCEIA